MKIKVNFPDQSEDSLQSAPGVRLLDLLVDSEIPINAACGGKATCFKCRVRVTNGFVTKTQADERAFRPTELEQGWRLSCQCRPRTPVTVEVPLLPASRSRPTIKEFKPGFWPSDLSQLKFTLDLGSTGLVLGVQLLNEPLLEIHSLNGQIKYGADVMTRLASAQRLGTEPLHRSILESIEKLVSTIPHPLPEIFNIYASGNSAMTTFLLNWPFECLATSPFQPFRTDSGEIDLQSSKNEWKAKIYTSPLLAGFVGGDTFSGIIHTLNIDPLGPWAFVDIGTNTEIVIYTGEKLWISSAPAGPAFEGGNITHGMRAEPGAIDSVWFEEEKYKYSTIGQDLPRGVCGSGLLDWIYQGVLHGQIDRDGALPEDSFRLTERVALYRDDIREFQLAKSATRTALDLLLNRAQTQVKTLYLAGTFGEHLKHESIYGVGLLPSSLEIKTLGNASLKGLMRWVQFSVEEKAQWTKRITENRCFIELALQDDFQDLFVKNLNF